MYSRNLGSWGRVITVIAALLIFGYIGYQLNNTFDNQKLKTARYEKKLDF